MDPFTGAVASFSSARQLPQVDQSGADPKCAGLAGRAGSLWSREVVPRTSSQPLAAAGLWWLLLLPVL